MKGAEEKDMNHYRIEIFAKKKSWKIKENIEKMHLNTANTTVSG